MKGLAEIQRDNAAVTPSQLTVDCQHCKATGRRALTYTEQVTLDEVPRLAWSSTGAIRDRLRTVKLTALANRLVDLERLGLVEHRVCATNHRIKEWRRKR